MAKPPPLDRIHTSRVQARRRAARPLTGMHGEPEVAELLRRAEGGDAEAQAHLFDALYGELREIAGRQMSHQPRDHTLQPTALVNEAFLRLFKGDDGGARRAEGRDLVGKTHFVRLASRVMRQVLVDHARRREADKRSPQGERVELDSLVRELERRSGGLVELDAALHRLQERSPELVKLVELRFFGGRTMAEVGDSLGVSERQAARLWTAARTFLRDQLEENPR